MADWVALMVMKKLGEQSRGEAARVKCSLPMSRPLLNKVGDHARSEWHWAAGEVG